MRWNKQEDNLEITDMQCNGYSADQNALELVGLGVMSHNNFAWYLKRDNCFPSFKEAMNYIKRHYK